MSLQSTHEHLKVSKVFGSDGRKYIKTAKGSRSVEHRGGSIMMRGGFFSICLPRRLKESYANEERLLSWLFRKDNESKHRCQLEKLGL